MESFPAKVEELAEIFAQHRCIPFIGAGCSVGHLRVDWDGLRDEMASALGIVGGDHPTVAGAYARAKGRDALVALLRERLRVGEFDPSRGEIQLRLMGLNVPTMYTTNQDPLIEQCFAMHGRRLSVVVDIAEIATLSPREPVLYKFHGDCARPESIVFTDDDYARRMPPSDHPLDIRLRSDALARTFVFLGYSFRDPNIRALFQQLQSLFGGRLPESYLIQFTPDAQFASAMHGDFGVHAISCRESYPDAASDEEAFFRFVRDLSKSVVYRKAEHQLEERFKPRVPPSFQVVTAMDVETVAHVVASGDVARASRALRGAYDQAVVAAGLQPTVAAQFAELCRLANDSNIGDLRGALFNLRLTEPLPAFEALSAAYAMANALPANGGMFEMFMPHLPGLDADGGAGRLLLVASAFLLLEAWGRRPTPRFYQWVAFMLHDPPPRSALDREVCQHLDAVFGRFYGSKCTTYEQPLDRADRLSRVQGRMTAGLAPGFERLRAGFIATMPKTTGRPYQQ